MPPAAQQTIRCQMVPPDSDHGSVHASVDAVIHALSGLEEALCMSLRSACLQLTLIGCFGIEAANYDPSDCHYHDLICRGQD